MILSYTVYALAGQELWCCLLCSCRPGALMSPFMLVRVRSVNVAFYARADQKLCAMQFRLVRARSFGSCSLGSCEQGVLVPFAVSARASNECLVLPFMLVQTRSFVPCSLGSCSRGASCPTV
ncbi:hypothetical protein ACFX19_047752 [Malus domestica]